MSSVIKPDRHHYTITEMPLDDRPRERLRERGPASLSDPELLAILLRTGIKGKNVLDLARQVLHQFDGLDGLHDTPQAYQDLVSISGISDAKACQILAGMQLGTRVEQRRTEKKPMNQPAMFASQCKDLVGKDQEILRVFLLNTKLQLKRRPIDVTVGTVTSSLARPAEILKWPVRYNVPSFAIAHNHPSGDPTPSTADTELTKTLIDIAGKMELSFEDHLIIGSGTNWYSFRRDNGYLWAK